MTTRDNAPPPEDWQMPYVTFVSQETFDRHQAELDEPPKVNEALRRAVLRSRTPISGTSEAPEIPPNIELGTE